MGKTAAELRYEIEQKRTDLSRDVDVIEDRIRPGRIVSRKTASVRQTMHRAKEAIMGTADDATTTMHDGVSSMKESAGSMTQEMGRKIDDLTTNASEAIGTATDKIAEAPAMVRQQTQGNPIAVGLVAFGLGLLAASLLPESEAEQELLGQVQPQLEDSARKLAEVGQSTVHDLRDNLEPEVRGAVEEVKSSVSESADHLVEQTKQGANEVKATAAEAAH